ncbi:hypothetical protein ACFWR6_06715 [Streptomyces griseus]|uniref:hypothetical protein n=1 Tax=Streptomyces griseus TaxID=1911 RepID=UPI0036654E45
MPDALRYEAPPGHSVAAHRTHGWCSHCGGRSPAVEVVAWRRDAAERHAADSGPLSTETDYRECPVCRHDATYAVVTVQVTTAGGVRKPAGGWAYCLNCEAVPGPGAFSAGEADRG